MTEGDWGAMIGCSSKRCIFVVENVAWRRLPGRFGKWNSVWKRVSRLSASGVFAACCEPWRP